MDASFDAFGGGGWGMDGGENEFSSQMHKSNIYEKVPIQITIFDLLKLMDSGDEQEKYCIGTYSFNTVRIIGRVAYVTTDVNSTTTYELCEQSMDVRTAKRFTVIRYEGAETPYNKPLNTYPVGTVIHAIGKLRMFNNRLSLVSFHIRESNQDEIDIFEMDAKLAKIYYRKKIPELSTQQMGEYASTIFCPGTIRHEKAKNGMPPPSTFNVSNANVTPNPKRSQIPTQTPFSTSADRNQFNNQVNNNSSSSRQQLYQPSQSKNHGFTPQQNRIFEFIREYSANESGVSLESIKQTLRPDSKISDDLHHLLSVGVIYSTTDDEHYAVV